MTDIALFPLPVVLFPGCRMPLQIFEPRYVDLVKRTLSGEDSFAIVTLIDDPGEQVVRDIDGDDLMERPLPNFRFVGTKVEIVDCETHQSAPYNDSDLALHDRWFRWCL